MDKSEVGRVFSSLSLVSALVPLVSGPLYSLVYNATLGHFAGTFMLVTSSLILAATAIMVAVWRIFIHQGRRVSL